MKNNFKEFQDLMKVFEPISEVLKWQTDTLESLKRTTDLCTRPKEVASKLEATIRDDIFIEVKDNINKMNKSLNSLDTLKKPIQISNEATEMLNKTIEDVKKSTNSIESSIKHLIDTFDYKA